MSENPWTDLYEHTAQCKLRSLIYRVVMKYPKFRNFIKFSIFEKDATFVMCN